MIGYTTFGTNDLERAAKFYDALLAELGGKRAMATDSLVLWASAPGTPMVGVIKPNDGKAATVGNGVMVALAAKDKAQVDAVYAKAIALGGKDEGKPGPRGGNFYAAYFRDLDGNKLNAFFMG
jgi:catechol 2,3-dioxygenase-like lactoylglutathione lyase family enzyme